LMDNKVKCLDCPTTENDDDDVEYDEDDQTSVTINKNGISINNDTTINTQNNIKELKINKDGIIIKTR
jgi:hypothetical protein